MSLKYNWKGQRKITEAIKLKKDTKMREKIIYLFRIAIYLQHNNLSLKVIRVKGVHKNLHQIRSGEKYQIATELIRESLMFYFNALINWHSGWGFVT